MKKIYMTLVAAMFAVCASAQVYVGGNVGIASVDNGHDDETVYSLLPEVGYKHYNGAGDKWSVGLKPGVELKLSKFSLVAHVGFIGYEKNDNDGRAADTSKWGLDFDGNNITLGLYYNF